MKKQKTKNKKQNEKKYIHITTKKKTVMPKIDHLYGRIMVPRPMRNAAKDNVKTETFILNVIFFSEILLVDAV